VNFDDARLLDQLAYDFLLAGYVRGQNRALIAECANGWPPYTDAEVERDGHKINVNDLSMPRLLHDARASFNNAFLKPGQFFTCRTDMGAKHKRDLYGSIVSKEINRPMKKSIQYMESMRAKGALLMLHGISPAAWENEDRWCPRPVGIEDVLIPSQTLLGFDNLPFFALRRSFTGYELQKLTQDAKRNPGWNLDLVDRLLRWADQQTTQLMGNNPWPDVWAPEKIQERIKESSGLYGSDQVPTIDCFDFYGWNDTKGEEGWVRRIILDGWSNPTNVGGKPVTDRRSDMNDFSKQTKGKKDSFRDFVFSSGNRKVASSWNNLMSFQFADLSAVAPFRYHSVRSLGFLLYSVCHLQNRMRCKFNESVFEALMQYFQVDSMEDAQRALKLELVNRGFIDKTIKPVPAGERWQPNVNLIELGIEQNTRLMGQNASSFSQNSEYGQDKQEKTATQVMAETNQQTAMVSAALSQAYEYQKWEYYEVVRRFFRPNSKDKDVQTARANMLRQGVPEKLMVYEAWDVEPERVMGAGNKTMELTIANTLMGWRDKFDPEPQRAILRDAVLAVTDDAAKAEMLVPETPVKVTPSVHDASLVASALLSGVQVDVQTGINHIETIETLLKILATKIKAGVDAGGMVEPKELAGLQAIADHIKKHIAIVAQDKAEAQRVKQYGDILGKLENELKGFAQRLQEMAKKQAQAGNGNGGLDPKDAAKIQATMLTAKTKAQIATQSAATRTVQKKMQFEQKMLQDQEKHQQQVQQAAAQHEADIAGKDLEVASNIGRNRLKSLDSEGGKE